MRVLLHICLRFFLFLALITTDGNKTVSTIKGCESLDICATPVFQLQMGNETSYKASVVCCTGRMCKKATPQFFKLTEKINHHLMLPVPAPQNALNGKKCPACYTSSGVCGNKTVSCTGLQKFCFDITTVMTTGGKEQDYIIRGCTTQSVCASILTNRSPVLGDVVVKKAACIPNPLSGSASPGLFLSLFYGCLLLKILL
ncbi:hypothetical protein JD844_005748 [Phrynosoma platyrhinos]|uniref:UPAR/Ly6 domain-containing protein n=1 Tax=Phrynosoma platyrhinos TaxID=52577 RepID=A0ABQ7TNR0_PHRPL|nr:hypothetical protein JD844_005748 [Phrynosoma platyrhinos]